MKKLLILAALLCLAVPAAHAAPPAGKGKPEDPGASASAPGQSAQKNAAKACEAERGTSPQTIAAFKEKYGSNANKANAFGKCVSKLAKQQGTKDDEQRDEDD